jgi:hypothetical protein
MIFFGSKHMRFFQIAGLAVFGLTAILSPMPANAQTRDEKVRQDRADLLDDEFWYYDDLDTGLAAAKQQQKPLMAVLRCIP